ncbi:MAG: 1-deoxy-D-xylulose-5-phosphate synthase [bacterium]|nr:1-deoxy-D-xylulose-5-phosphate synthase [bacterium]
MTAGVLERVNSPGDVRALDYAMLGVLGEEIRSEIMRIMAANGGHLATNLGTVELSLALHYVFDSPTDKIIWDVGNQCYTHKLITGRRDRFSMIRKGGGLSGFVNRQESPHDHMTAGHAGTALSSALGIAAGRDRLGADYCVAAVVGDGAMTAGMSFEALNNLSGLGSQLLLVLNDNDFAISRSGGALARTLQQAKSKIRDGSIFEQLGITYLGPVDGHDLRLLTGILEEVKQIDRPVVLHVLTQKGRGYEPAERDPQRFHGVSPFDPVTGQTYVKSASPSYSELFGREMINLAADDERVVAITAAMCAGTGLSEFAKTWPDRCFDVGIAEQHAVTFGAGLAVAGCRPVVAIYSSFLQRGFDQVIHDVCLQDLPVTFVLDRAGIVGADGPTHHGVFDLGFLRMLPHMVVMAPRDGHEFKLMLRAAVDHDGPAAVRIPRGAAPEPLEPDQPSEVEIGKGELLREGSDVALIAIGSLVHLATRAAEALQAKGVSAAVVNARFVKPLDEALIVDAARRVKHVFTLEEHAALGGFGSAVSEMLLEHRVGQPVSILGLPDEFIEHGSAEQLLDECGLSVDKVVERVLQEQQFTETSVRPARAQVSPEQIQSAIQAIRNKPLPEDLEHWVRVYAEVGHRDPFLWKWCLEGVELTSLPCVDLHLRQTNNVTKVLGVMLDVLLDDVADRSGDSEFLELLLAIPFGAGCGDLEALPSDQQIYARTAGRLWDAIWERARAYPRFDEFLELFRFDWQQLLNTMRYSHMVNGDPSLLNLAEHDLYLPHNMHMMISGTLDLMCSESFDAAELGAIREAVWHAQCMGRVGNLVTTWERELEEGDLTSGVFARALQVGALRSEDLAQPDRQRVRAAIKEHDCEGYFIGCWEHHRAQIASRAGGTRSVDLRCLLEGLERLFTIHVGSRGLK